MVVGGRGCCLVTRGNQQRLSIHGRSDPSQGAKWEPGRKALCLIQGLLVLRPAWSKLPLGCWPPRHLCNSGPFRPKMNDRMALSPLLVRGNMRGEIKTTGVAVFCFRLMGGGWKAVLKTLSKHFFIYSRATLQLIAFVPFYRHCR